MDSLGLREPISALSHAAGVALAIPGLALLGRAGLGKAQRASMLIFGASLVACYAASALYHGAHGPPGHIDFLRRLDHVGIHVLIAGTYTPVAVILLRGRWRSVTLAIAWTAAAGGAAVLLTYGVLPSWLSTSIYLGLGWGAYFSYREIGRRHPNRDLRALVEGGYLYSAGAVVNLAGWPVLWPGWIEAHELFHLFVLAASFRHFGFVLGLVGWLRPSADLTSANLRVEPGHGRNPDQHDVALRRRRLSPRPRSRRRPGPTDPPGK